MREYPKNRYVSGTYKRICDICGFDYLRSELRKNYNGLLVCTDDYEEEHPQDKIKSRTAKKRRIID